MRIGPVADVAWQELAVGGLILLTAYWVIRGDVLKTLGAVGDFGKAINEGLKATFDPNYAGVPLQLSESAQTQAERYVELGYAKWVNGVLTITPAGEQYISSKASTQQVIQGG